MAELAGLRILIVEDEGTVAFLLEEMLEELGCEVAASAARVSRAEEAIRSTAVDLALLDVNLGGETSFDLARDLIRRAIPLVFSTGYGNGGLPPDLQGRPVLTKPFTSADLQQAMAEVLAED